MLSKNRIAGKFKFPRNSNLSYVQSALCDFESILLGFGYAVSVEPMGDEYLVDVYEPDNFENRPLPFGEDV